MPRIRLALKSKTLPLMQVKGIGINIKSSKAKVHKQWAIS